MKAFARRVSSALLTGTSYHQDYAADGTGQAMASTSSSGRRSKELFRDTGLRPEVRPSQSTRELRSSRGRIREEEVERVPASHASSHTRDSCSAAPAPHSPPPPPTRQRRESTSAMALEVPSTAGSKRKSEDRVKRSRKDSSTGRVNTHEFWALSGNHDARVVDSSSPPKRQSSPSILKESRLRLGRGDSKSALLKDKEHLTARVHELQDQLRSSEERNRSLDTLNQSLSHDLQRTLSQSRRQQAIADELAATIKSTADAAEKKVSEMEAKMKELQAKAQQLETRNQKLRAQFERTDSKNAEIAALLDIRTAELKGAQTFLTKADLFSGGDIVRMVDGINSEIFQCCAYIAETVMSEEAVRPEDAHVVSGCRMDVATALGEPLAVLLEKNTKTSRDPLPLQTALQMMMIAYTIHILTAFDLDDEVSNNRLSLIYERASASEEQSVAGRWRAITMAQLRALHTSGMRAKLNKDMLKVMIAAGASRMSPSYPGLYASMKSRLALIEKSVYTLKQAISEGITSADIVPFSWPSGTPYDGGAGMENMYPEARGEQALAAEEAALNGRPIIGTAEFGLHKVTVVRLQDGSVFRQKDMLTKPKVVLAQTLDEVVES